MKVMCVKRIPENRCGITGEIMPVPEVGDIDVVIDTEKNDYGVFYAFERFGMECLYGTKFFAILPDATADEMAEAEQEAILM